MTGMAYINLGVLALVELGNVSDPQAFGPNFRGCTRVPIWIDRRVDA